MSGRAMGAGRTARALMTAVGLVGGLGSVSVHGQAPAGRTLTQVLAANLPGWTGGSGNVEKARLEALAADPTIRGEDAAALAALIRQFRKGTTTSLPTADVNPEGQLGLDQSY